MIRRNTIALGLLLLFGVLPICAPLQALWVNDDDMSKMPCCRGKQVCCCRRVKPTDAAQPTLYEIPQCQQQRGGISLFSPKPVSASCASRAGLFLYLAVADDAVRSYDVSAATSFDDAPLFERPPPFSSL
jgi:hypothetical protein